MIEPKEIRYFCKAVEEMNLRGKKRRFLDLYSCFEVSALVIPINNFFAFKSHFVKNKNQSLFEFLLNPRIQAVSVDEAMMK